MIAKKLQGLVFVAIFLLNGPVTARQLNVYLGFDDNALQTQIKQFMCCPQVQNLLSRYDIEPFITQFPLHISLYLASYKQNKITDVLQTVREETSRWASFDIQTSKVYLAPSNYLMLDVEFNSEYKSHPILQELSDIMVLRLHPTRDFMAPLPSWILPKSAKEKAF